MSEERISERRYFDSGFCFVSFGVRIGIQSSSPVMLDKARDLIGKAFGDRAKIFEDTGTQVQRVFGIEDAGGKFHLFKDGVETTSGSSERNFFKYLNSMLRLEVAEHVEGRVFLHAGVVGWKGQAIVFPGTSFAGKSTLTAELVKNGADYYSDEYAVLAADGRVTPFPRHVSLRYFGGKREKDVPVSEFGGKIGTEALPVGMLLLTSFSRDGEWQPERLSPGEAIMEIIPHTLSMRKNPAFCLKVLDLVARRAIIVRSPRGDARKFAKFLLEFFDNNSILANIT